MAALNQVTTLFGELQKEWTKPTRNLKRCGEILDQLKVNTDQKFVREMSCRKFQKLICSCNFPIMTIPLSLRSP